MRSPRCPGGRCLLLPAALLLAACVTVRPVVLDRKTQLENQILGTFQQLDRDLVLLSSVREGSAGEDRGGLSPLEREAAEAALVREFNRDDIEDLKARQVAGEGNDGLLALLSPPEEEQPAARARRLVSEENSSREVIIRRVIQLNRDLSDADLPLVRSIFHRLAVKGAKPGELVQREDGKWRAVVGTSDGAEGGKTGK